MSRLWFALLFLVPLPAVIFLARDGYFASSDGMIHLYRLFELDRALHNGVLYPRWFPLSGYGYGLPVLNYYPPLSYYLSEWFNLAGAGYIGSIKLLIVFGFVTAAFSMFLFARDLLGDASAFVAAVAYVYLPYLLSDAYVRGNFPEFLAMSILPLGLWAFRRLFDRRPAYADEAMANQSAGPDRTHKLRSLTAVLFAGFVFAFIILAHHLTAMLFAALLAAYILFLFSGQRDWRQLVASAAAIVLGLGLSAFYWLPSIAELNLVFVGPASVARFLVNRLVEVAEFLTPSLAYDYLPQAEVLKHAFGFPQTLLALLVGIVVLMISFRARSISTNSRITFHALFFVLIVIASIFMTLSFSAPLWYAIPTLRFMQFPWRFEILTGIGIAFLLGVGAKWLAARAARLNGAKVTYALASVALVALGVTNLPVRDFPLTDAAVNLYRAADSDYVIAQMGWGWTREFVPAAVQDVDAIYSPVAKPSVPAPAVQVPPSIRVQQTGPLSAVLQVSTPGRLDLSLHTFYFPEWQAYVDNAPARTFPRGSLGLVSVTVPPGDHAVSFRFEDTPIRVVSNAISLLTLLVCLAALLLIRRRATIVGLAAIALATGLSVGHAYTVDAGSFGAALAPPLPLSANLDYRVMLAGYSTDQSDYRVGETIYVTLYWFALNEMDQDYQVFVHLVGPGDASLAQQDGPPDQGLTPTTRWLPGEIVVDHHALALKSPVPGEYQLVAGMYLPTENGYTKLGEDVELGRVKVGE
ncbi:MAG TPA: 6-pyruvoyl-tetrahydropterin synthase-related protein [Anaerolineae bacterium]